MTAGTKGSAAQRRSVVLVAMTLANAMVLVDQTAVPLVLPSVLQEFGVGSQQVQWVLSASLLALAGLLVAGGRLGDLFGRRRVFLLGSALFAGASACAGLAPTFGILVFFRVLQGAGGALMLPTTVAMVSAAYPGRESGRALGAMGGAAAVAGALGPVIGGTLTSAFGWRSVMLVNVPLAVVAVALTLHAAERDPVRTGRRHLDARGTALLSLALISFVFGLAQSQVWGWASPGVLLPLVVSVLAGASFVLVEHRSPDPLLDFRLLRRHPHYLGATLSQALAGLAEMGLGVIFPLLLILNLEMDPGVAGLALIPTTLPMIVVAPLAGRWYDKAGGRAPLLTGFGVLTLAALLLAVGVHANNYWVLLPGLLTYGVGLALVLTLNDPVSLDTVPEESHGQASGVSATAEQFGGAVGIAVLYLVLHTTYVSRLKANIDASPLTDLTDAQYAALRDDIVAAEQTGLRPQSFDPSFVEYLQSALNASAWGMSAAFGVTALLGVAGVAVVWRLVR